MCSLEHYVTVRVLVTVLLVSECIMNVVLCVGVCKVVRLRYLAPLVVARL